jgi:hypothetical protein
MSDFDQPAGGMAFPACRFATAHLAIALVALLVVTGAADLWPAIEAGGHPLEVDAAARQATWAALAYLIVTGLAELRTGWQLDRCARGGSAAPLRLTPHLLVLLAAGIALVRGFRSLALLAGLYVVLPGLITVSFLTLALGLIQRRTLRASAAERAQDGARPSAALLWIGLQWIAALVFIGLLAMLERQPLPHSEPAAFVESPTDAAVESGARASANRAQLR